MEKTLKQQLKELYMTAFPDDTESYVDFFLDNKYDGSNCMTVFDGGTLVSMLFLVKKKMVIRGTVFDIPYMTAGATLPSHRGRGIFSSVMLEAMENFQKLGNRPVTGLMPSSHEFYRRHGFVTHSFTDERSLKKGKLPLTAVSFADIPEMKRVYDSFMKGKSGWFSRDSAAFELRLKEIFNEEGKAYALRENGRFGGYILTFDDEEIEEYCAKEENYIEKFDTPFCSYCVNTGSGGEEENMIRLCDNAALLNMMRYPEGLDGGLSLEVTDSFHVKNSGRYKLEVGSGRGAVSQLRGGAEFVLTVEEFSRLAMGCYPSGMFNEKLERFFPPALNCALEKF